MNVSSHRADRRHFLGLTLGTLCASTAQLPAAASHPAREALPGLAQFLQWTGQSLPATLAKGGDKAVLRLQKSLDLRSDPSRPGECFSLLFEAEGSEGSSDLYRIHLPEGTEVLLGLNQVGSNPRHLEAIVDTGSPSAPTPPPLV